MLEAEKFEVPSSCPVITAIMVVHNCICICKISIQATDVHKILVCHSIWSPALIIGHSDLTLRLTPALHPAATSIDVVLTGKSGRVTVTLPLDWQEGA